MTASMERFIYLTDLHFGYERKAGHRVPLHDSKALSIALKFMADFKPDHVVLGGDMLDCACISHHNHGKPGAVEGFRLLGDAKELRKALIEPVEALTKKTLTYITGNHERWLQDLVDKIPALEGMIDVRSVLSLSERWKVVPQGGAHMLGKLVFIHGDQISGGDNAAKNAVISYEKNVRLGHFHTYSSYTKTSCMEYKQAKTGLVVPCLCRRFPSYGKGKPNKWAQGLLYGYLLPGGGFHDYVAVITDGKTVINGKEYRG